MAEKAAVLGWVVLRQGGDPFGGMTFLAELFGLFLVHGQESGMVLIVWEVLGCLFGSVPEKQENTGTHEEENQVIEEKVFPFALIYFRIHCYFLVSQTSPAC